tara:strand:- start:351 stop:860 length:510 start_codon:yes stop_codon:yes gene_type:complete
MTVVIYPTDATLATDKAFNGLQFKADDAKFTAVSVLLDLDMRTGTPVSETAWLDGGAAAGSYPGALDGFKAKNTNTTNAGGSLRMVTVELNLEDAAVSPIIITAGASKIVAILGTTMPLADKTLSVIFTNTGKDNGSSVPSKDNGVLPCLEFHAEGAVDNVTCTFMVLG